MEFCDENNCIDCCLNAKVPLLNEDINRIVMYGYYDAFFVDEHEGIKMMRTREDGSCVFYTKHTGECAIDRTCPERCMLNPLTICERTFEPEVDEACRHCHEAKVDEAMKERMKGYMESLQKEIDWRRRTGHF